MSAVSSSPTPSNPPRAAVRHFAAPAIVAATALLAIHGGAVLTADPKALADCGNSCHVAVKAKDYIFHPYQMR